MKTKKKPVIGWAVIVKDGLNNFAGEWARANEQETIWIFTKRKYARRVECPKRLYKDFSHAKYPEVIKVKITPLTSTKR